MLRTPGRLNLAIRDGIAIIGCYQRIDEREKETEASRVKIPSWSLRVRRKRSV
jgi:hypothetical protein